MMIELPFPPSSLSGHNTFARELPPQEVLRALLDYDPETGRFFWKRRGEVHFDAQFAGKEALNCGTGTGYLGGNLLQCRVRAHRVAFKYVYGFDAPEIDHINGDRRDNRICNLRAVTRVENGRNLKRSKRNTSGVTGVSFRSSRRKWRATIRSDGHQVFLGNFDTMEDAAAARKRAERDYGFHTNHGRVR